MHQGQGQGYGQGQVVFTKWCEFGRIDCVVSHELGYNLETIGLVLLIAIREDEGKLRHELGYNLEMTKLDKIDQVET